MRALLLAAGLGTRLKPITNNIPKCLVDINGQPLLKIWLDLIFKSKLIDKVLINTHYLHKKVTDFVETTSFESKIEITFEQSLLGTGGTILQNKAFFDNKSFFVAHADNLAKFDIDRFIRFHNKRDKKILITMMTFRTDEPSNCGIVELNDYGYVINFHEKKKDPPGNLANAAIYIFQPEVIEYIQTLNKNIIDISTDVIPKFLGKIQAYQNNLYLRDIGNLKSLELGCKEYKLKM